MRHAPADLLGGPARGAAGDVMNVRVADADKVVALRRAFDSGFAAAPAAGTEAPDVLLCVRVGDDRYLLRLIECAGVVRAGRITPLPNRSEVLLGCAGVNGVVVPVFSLAALLRRSDAVEPPSWLVLCGPATERFALAVAELEGTLQLAPTKIVAVNGGASPHTTAVAQTSAGARMVLSIPSILKVLRTRAADDPGKER